MPQLSSVPNLPAVPCQDKHLQWLLPCHFQGFAPCTNGLVPAAFGWWLQRSPKGALNFVFENLTRNMGTCSARFYTSPTHHHQHHHHFLFLLLLLWLLLLLVTSVCFTNIQSPGKWTSWWLAAGAGEALRATPVALGRGQDYGDGNCSQNFVVLCQSLTRKMFCI